MENIKTEKCPVVNVDGFIEKGKQFDIDIVLPEDNRNLIYGIIKDCYEKPVENAAVKLIEVCYEYGKKELRPVSHTFTDKDGEFVFGPLCPDKSYEVKVWASKVEHVKVCAGCSHTGACLEGTKTTPCPKPESCSTTPAPCPGKGCNCKTEPECK
ncbi:MAG: carboxypeptidase-like regulatory domain-containing protein [Lachnospiraceae bacterium]|jgi:hypothetical protein|nr:carboxypeptidase-like regulatory domain-containing protein [Lachnospiraceae bacterium]